MTSNVLPRFFRFTVLYDNNIGSHGDADDDDDDSDHDNNKGNENNSDSHYIHLCDVFSVLLF